MNLESQVTSLELSQKLKEIGVKQKGLGDFIIEWRKIPTIVHMKLNKNGSVFKDKTGSTVVDRTDYEYTLGGMFSCNIPPQDCCSAYTVAELGEILPYSIDSHGALWHLEIKKFPKCFRVTYRADECGILNTFIDSNETNARAKMLIYLIENKLIT